MLFHPELNAFRNSGFKCISFNGSGSLPSCFELSGEIDVDVEVLLNFAKAGAVGGITRNGKEFPCWEWSIGFVGSVEFVGNHSFGFVTIGADGVEISGFAIKPSVGDLATIASDEFAHGWILEEYSNATVAITCSFGDFAVRNTRCCKTCYHMM